MTISRKRALRDSLQKDRISRSAIRRLARRGGVKRISGLAYEEVRGTARAFVERIVTDAMLHTECAGRRTITALDVVHALKVRGRTLYGFGSDDPGRSSAAPAAVASPSAPERVESPSEPEPEPEAPRPKRTLQGCPPRRLAEMSQVGKSYV
jgi:histone H3/H4